MAALTPPQHRVRVFHQQTEPVDLETDADLVPLTFFSGFAPEAFRPGSFLLSAMMNGFYGLKRLRGNVPKTMG